MVTLDFVFAMLLSAVNEPGALLGWEIGVFLVSGRC